MSFGLRYPFSGGLALTWILGGAIALAPFKLRAAWVAYDGHARGPGTGLNVSNGSSSVVQTQYRGLIWGGDDADTTNYPGYAITTFRLEEAPSGPTVSITGPDNNSIFVAPTGIVIAATSAVAYITVSNNLATPGRVYLVVGSDTAIWNDGSTVDVYSRHPHYPQTFFTDPASPSYQVMDPTWRSQFKDSFGQPVKFTWWMMGGNIYREADNLNVPVNNTMVLYLMKKYHGAAIRQFGDEVSLHYHTFLWSDYNGDGQSFWNQAQSFNDCRADFDYTLAQYLLEEEVFPVSFRSGWHYMDNDWQQYLDQLLPFTMHDNWPVAQGWYTNEPINNVQDWSRAPGIFVPFHPATNDYQVPGTGKGWNLRSIKMQRMVQSDMDSVFASASNGVDQVVCIWNHLPENFIPDFVRIDAYAHITASNYPAVPFRYCTAVEAMQRWLGTTERAPPEIDVSEITQGQTVTLAIHTSRALFQPQPFVALRDTFQQCTNLTASCVPAGSNTWMVTLPVPRDALAKIGIAATDPVGNLATRILRYLPDDLYIDNLDPQYVELQGNWMSISNAAWGTDARIALLSSSDTARVRWSLPLTRSGRFSISVQVPPLTNAAGNVSFNVYSGNSNIYSVFFPAALPGNRWVYLGATLLDQTRSNCLEMVVPGTNQPGALAVADVIKVVPLPDTNAPIISELNHLAIAPAINGFLLRFAGEPGWVCGVQRSTDPGTGWITLATIVVPPNGLLEYEDRNPPLEAAFYRVTHSATNAMGEGSGSPTLALRNLKSQAPVTRFSPRRRSASD